MSRCREVVAADLPWQRVTGQDVYIRSYHRPLSLYVRALRSAGLVIAALRAGQAGC